MSAGPLEADAALLAESGAPAAGDGPDGDGGDAAAPAGNVHEDVFAMDRRGLLYTITRTLFELGYSVWRAKIGTFLDQVVDVFYVTDQGGQRVEDPERLQRTRERLLEVIRELEKEAG